MISILAIFFAKPLYKVYKQEYNEGVNKEHPKIVRRTRK